MDAIIVDGTSLTLGAVAAIRNVAHPLAVARRVMETTPHCMLAGDGATRFAREQGFPFVPTGELCTKRPPADAKGTVGAVAMDAQGHLAAATSTGGMRGQMPGRVGDSAIFGCGAYAEDGVGSISATGHGEAIMRVMLAREAAEHMRHGSGAQAAAERALEILQERTGSSTAGLILLGPEGTPGLAHRTPHMAAGCVNREEAVAGTIWRDGQPA
jgi:beta-aspartyl-peptidase (threonine type)